MKPLLIFWGGWPEYLLPEILDVSLKHLEGFWERVRYSAPPWVFTEKSNVLFRLSKDPQEPSGGRKVKSAWQTGSSGRSHCLPSRFHIAQAKFQIKLQHILKKISFEIWKDWKGALCCTIIGFQQTDKRVKLFAQLNLKLKEVLSCNESNLPVNRTCHTSHRARMLDVKID